MERVVSRRGARQVGNLPRNRGERMQHLCNKFVLDFSVRAALHRSAFPERGKTAIGNRHLTKIGIFNRIDLSKIGISQSRQTTKKGRSSERPESRMIFGLADCYPQVSATLALTNTVDAETSIVSPRMLLCSGQSGMMYHFDPYSFCT